MGGGWPAGAARTLSGKEPALGTSIRLLLGGVTARPDPQHPHPVRSGRNASEQLLASVLQLNLTHDADFGVFACWINNATATFTLQQAGRDLLGTRRGHPTESPGARGGLRRVIGALLPLPYWGANQTQVCCSPCPSLSWQRRRGTSPQCWQPSWS